MDGIYLFYSTNGADGSSGGADGCLEPSVIVLSEPQLSASQTRTSPASSPSLSPAQPPLSVCDVDLLRLFYRAFPSSFIVLVAPAPSPTAPATFAGDQCNNEGYAVSPSELRAAYESSGCSSSGGGGSKHDALRFCLRQAQAMEDAFFDESTVQQRTCRLTLGLTGTAAGEAPQRHSLHLSPSSAARVMQQHAWLRGLHECPRTLCYAAQVAAVLLLLQPSVTPAASSLLYMPTAAALELVTQCSWMGDSATAAAVLTCVTSAISAREAELQWMADPVAMARGRRGLPPLMPTWVSGSTFPLLKQQQQPQKHRHHLGTTQAALTAPPPPALPPLLSAVSGGSGAAAELSVREAYCTCTSEPLHSTGSLAGCTANVLGGSIAMTRTAANTTTQQQREREGNGDKTYGSDDGDAAVSPLAQEVVHLVVFTALGGAASEQEGDAVRPSPRRLLTPLLQFLKADVTALQETQNADVQLRLHLSVNGRDALADGSDGPERDAYETRTALVSRPVADAQRVLATADLQQYALLEEEEDFGVISRMLDQCEVTLQQVRQTAHRHRVLWVRQQALRMRQKLQQTNSTAAARSSGGFSSSPSAAAAAVEEETEEEEEASPLSIPTATRAAVLLCTDEYHLAQWAESGHSLTAPVVNSSGSDDSDETALLSPWASFYDTPVYVCLLPSSSVSPPRLLFRLCDAPSVIKGLRAARQLCARTHGFLLIGSDHGNPNQQAGQAGGKGGGNGPVTVVRGCEQLMASVVAHLHAWMAATFRNVQWCVFSELPPPPPTVTPDGEGWPSSGGERYRARNTRGRRRVDTTHVTLDSLPHCEVCAPSATVQIRSAAAHVRLWRCQETLLSPATPVAPFLTYESTPAPQPWVEELVAQYAFAFAHTRTGSGVLCAVSAVARVQPRLVLFKPGPLLQWYNQQFHLHHATAALDAVLEAQVEQVKSLFFVLAATESGRAVRRGVVTAQEREAQAEAVMKALQRLTLRVTRLREGDEAALNTLRLLIPANPLDDHRQVRVAASPEAEAWGDASPLYVSQRTAAPLPPQLQGVLREVEAARAALVRDQQRKEYQLGEPQAPSPADACAAVTRFLSLSFLKARVMELHAVYAAGSGDYRVSLAERVLARFERRAVAAAAETRASNASPVRPAVATKEQREAQVRCTAPVETLPRMLSNSPCVTAVQAEYKKTPTSVETGTAAPVEVMEEEERRMGEADDPLRVTVPSVYQRNTRTPSPPPRRHITLVRQEKERGEEEETKYAEHDKAQSILSPQQQSPPLSLSPLPMQTTEGVLMDADTSPPWESAAGEGCTEATELGDTSHVGGADATGPSQLFNVVLPGAAGGSSTADPMCSARGSVEGTEGNTEASPHEIVPSSADGYRTFRTAFIRLRCDEDKEDDKSSSSHHGGSQDHEQQQQLRDERSPVQRFDVRLPTTRADAAPPAAGYGMDVRLCVAREKQPTAVKQTAGVTAVDEERKAELAVTAHGDADPVVRVGNENSTLPPEPFSPLPPSPPPRPSKPPLTPSSPSPGGTAGQREPTVLRLDGATSLTPGADAGASTSKSMECTTQRENSVGGSSAEVHKTQPASERASTPSLGVSADSPSTGSALSSPHHATAQRMHARRPTALPQPCREEKGEGDDSALTPHGTHDGTSTPLADRSPPPPPPPPPPRDLRWCAATPTEGPSATRAATDLAALLTHQLPSHATLRTAALSVARYAAGTLTVEVLEATTAAAAALAAHRVEAPDTRPPLLAPPQPAAYLVLFSVDVATGALHLRESLPCAVAPGIAVKGSTGLAPRVADQQTGEAVSSSDRSQHSFETRLSSREAVAVVYVGLRHALRRGVGVREVLWVAGVAFTLFSPVLRQVRVTAVQADGFAVEWSASESASVKVLVSELATAPVDALHAARVLSSTQRAAADMARTDPARSSVLVGHDSPMVISSLRMAAIYLVQVVPIPPAKQPGQLESVVDGDLSVSAVVAATSLTPTVDFMRVQDVREAVAPLPSTDLAVGASGTMQITSEQQADALRRPLVTGAVVSPLLRYCTPFFPPAVLRHCALVRDVTANGATTPVAHQLVRLHFSLVPLISEDTDAAALGDTTVVGSAGEGQPSRSPGHLVAQANKGSPLAMVSPQSAHNKATKEAAYRHVFQMRAGEETGLAMALGVRLDAEVMRPSHAPDAPSASTQFLSVFEAVQRRALRAVLGPFHTCGPCVNARETSGGGLEVSWTGTCAAYEVSVTRLRTDPVSCLGVAVHDRSNSNGAGGRDVAAPSARLRDRRMAWRSKAPATTGGERGESGAHLYRVVGQRDAAQLQSPSASRADRDVPMYRAVLHLSDLLSASAYRVRVRCASNHVGRPAETLWHTRPPPPPPQSCQVVFDSSTRRLSVRCVQHRHGRGSDTTAGGAVNAQAVLEAAVHPLMTTLRVPVEASPTAASSGDTESSDAESRVALRVVDCSPVAPGTPICLVLRQCVEWQDNTALFPTNTAGGTEDKNKRKGEDAACTRRKSDKVVYCVVSDLAVTAMATGPVLASASAEPVVALSWTCGQCDDIPKENVSLVGYLELNGCWRVPVRAENANRLELSLSDLRRATARSAETVNETKENTVDDACDAQLSSPPPPRPTDDEESPWTSLVCITGFGAASPPPPPRLQEQQRREGEVEWSGVCGVRYHLVPDRRLPVLLPPPPRLPASAFHLQNYQDEACVTVKVREVYQLYYDRLFRAASSDRVVAAGGVDDRALEAQLRQRLCLSLLVSTRDDSDEASQQRFPLSLPRDDDATVQRARIPLPAYRPYNGQLFLSLHVSTSSTNAAAQAVVASPTGINANDPFGDVAASQYVFFVPLPVSHYRAAVAIPPAEPITDVAVSAITAHDAVVDWTPPLSLLRHLRQQPDTPASYEVRLRAARPVPSAGTKKRDETAAVESLPSSAASASRVWVCADPHVVLTALEPATPYTVEVRGTGFGDYYSTVRFMTAPVVDAAVVAQLKASLSVESVAHVGAADALRTSAANVSSGQRRGLTAHPQRPALWAVLPASQRIRWTMENAKENVSSSSSSSLPPQLDVTTEKVCDDVVEAVTHHTASLVAANGELLRQWCSSPDTTTTMFMEWERPCDSGDEWPHLELSATVQLLEEGWAAAGGASASLSSFTLPHRSQSGVFCRTRLELISQPRLVAAEPTEACAVTWAGSSTRGYSVSWCLPSAPHSVHHAFVPATGSMARFALLAADVEREKRRRCQDSGGRAASNEVDVPTCVMMCVSSCNDGQRSDAVAVNMLSSGSVGRCLSATSPPRCFAASGVTDGGSNLVCVAWLLPRDPAPLLPADVSVVHHTSRMMTLLLPRASYHVTATRHVEDAAMESVREADSADARELSQAVQRQLRRQWSVEPTAGGEGSSELVVSPWSPEQYAMIATGGVADDGRASLNDGRTLVDLHLPDCPTASASAIAVNLRCCDAVADRAAGVWQRVVRHITEAHSARRADHQKKPRHDSSVAALPSLRWLQARVETTYQQQFSCACTLRGLELGCAEESALAQILPVARSGGLGPAARLREVDEAAAKAPSRSGGQRSRRWLPLQSSPAAAESQPVTPQCRLQRMMGVEVPVEGNKTDDESADNDAVDGGAAERINAATAAELKALQAWTQRGHPTLRSRLTWASNDDVFVVRLVGPYEPAGEAAAKECMDVEGAAREERGKKKNAKTSVDGKRTAEAEVRRTVRSLLDPVHLPSIDDMPHQRVYTCVPAAAATSNAAPHHSEANDGAYIALNTDGSVVPVVAAPAGDEESSLDTHASLRHFSVEMDGLLPEAFYRVEVRGRRSGDTVLRAQFITPPSCLTQLVTIRETTPAEVDGRPTTGGGNTPVAAAQTLSLHARVYNPHAYHTSQDDQGQAVRHGRQRVQLAPGVAYHSYATLEVVSSGSGKCESELRTYSSSREKEAGAVTGAEKEDDGEVHHADSEVRPVTESALRLTVDDAVRIDAVRHLRVEVAASPSAHDSFARTHIWGPIRCLTHSISHNVDARDICAAAALSPLQPHHAQARLTLCNVPALPRIENLHVSLRTPHSLQLSWRWWSRHRPRSDAAHGTAETLLCVRCCRVSSLPLQQQQQQQQQQEAETARTCEGSDGCTTVVSATAHPRATLAPLQPGALYVVCIQEIAREQAADARAASPSSLIDLLCRAPLCAAHGEESPSPRAGLHDLYSIRPVAPPPSVLVALRALANTSARPASLLLLLPPPPLLPSLSHSNGGAGTRLRVPRGAAVCYAMTCPLPLMPLRSVMDTLRRRPNALSLSLPAAYAKTQWADSGSAALAPLRAEVRVLRYLAAVLVPEGVVYVPQDAVAAVQAWWRASQGGGQDAAGEMWRWWAATVQTSVEQHAERRLCFTPDDGRRVSQRRASTTGQAAAEHWNAQLARCVGCRVEATENAPPQGTSPPPPQPLRVCVMEMSESRSGQTANATAAAPSNTAAFIRFTIPLNEPPWTVEREGESDGPSAAQQGPVSRTVYLLQCTHALPVHRLHLDTTATATARVGRTGVAVVGGHVQLTVCHAPLAVRRLQLVRDVSVRSTTTTTTVTESASAEPPAVAVLRLRWRWPTWADGRAAACVSCTPSPSLAPQDTAAEQPPLPSSLGERSPGNTAKRKERTASPSLVAEPAFIKHVEDGAAEVTVPNLAPSTLYKIRFCHVRLTTETGSGGMSRAIRCADKSITALTPPAPPPEHHQLPAVRYTVLPAKPPKRPSPSRGDACTVMDAGPPLTPPAPAGVEVRFHLPLAFTTAQGLLVCAHALLVNLDAVDIAACESAEDFIAATQAERVAPHALHRTDTAKALSDAAAQEAPLVYVNTSTEKRLRTSITLQRPLQQRYALVFFNAVYYGWHSPVVDEVAAAAATTSRRAHAKALPHGLMAAPTAAKVMYSAVVVKPLQYPAAVHAAYRSPPAPTPDNASSSRWRRLICRPSKLYVYDRTPACLTVRWQLDLSVWRLSDRERLRLLRHGQFAVRLVPDPSVHLRSNNSSIAERLPLTQASHTPSSSLASSRAAAPLGERTVFYRANASPQPLAASHTSRSREGDEALTESGTTCYVSVSDYLTTMSDGDDETVSERESAENVLKPPPAASAIPSSSHLSPTSCPSTVDEFRTDGHSSNNTTSGGGAGGENATQDAQSSHGCLTYELRHLCHSHSAAHAGYTVTVSLSPAWNTAGGEAEALEPALVPAELTSLTMHVPSVSLPAAVQRVLVTQVTETACSLEWVVVVAPGGQRPSSYVVESVRHPEHGDSSSGDARQVEAGERRQLWVRGAQQTAVTVEELQPHSTYTIRVIPCNVYDELCVERNATVTVHTH